jgi:hypothetical protein
VAGPFGSFDFSSDGTGCPPSETPQPIWRALARPRSKSGAAERTPCVGRGERDSSGEGPKVPLAAGAERRRRSENRGIASGECNEPRAARRWPTDGRPSRLGKVVVRLRCGAVRFLVSQEIVFLGVRENSRTRVGFTDVAAYRPWIQQWCLIFYRSCIDCRCRPHIRQTAEEPRHGSRHSIT